MEKTVELRNKIKMPRLILGVPMICEAAYVTKDLFRKTVINAIEFGICGLDTSHDYGQSEPILGKIITKMIKNGLQRESIFITTKIGNTQQTEENIERYVDEALRRLKTDYLDAMLLHWPYPDVFIRNWEKLVRVYETGKVRSIGIANAKIRHLEKIEKAQLMLPHILQTEIHPLHTSEEEQLYCNEKGISIQACTSLCSMIPLIRNNEVLNEVADNHGKAVAQIILRWHIQKNLCPIFRSYNEKHLQEMASVFDFELSKNELEAISNQNIDYRYHPESVNCPGF